MRLMRQADIEQALPMPQAIRLMGLAFAAISDRIGSGCKSVGHAVFDLYAAAAVYAAAIDLDLGQHWNP